MFKAEEEDALVAAADKKGVIDADAIADVEELVAALGAAADAEFVAAANAKYEAEADLEFVAATVAAVDAAEVVAVDGAELLGKVGGTTPCSTSGAS